MSAARLLDFDTSVTKAYRDAVRAATAQ